MDIKKYIWDIWNIGKKNDTYIGVALDMFLTNCEHGKAEYPGADLDYKTLGETWNALTDDEKADVKAEYGDVTRAYFADLTEARRENNREKFDSILEGTND